MGLIYAGSTNAFSAPIWLNSGKALDVRTIVDDHLLLTGKDKDGNYNYMTLYKNGETLVFYEGMMVYAIDTKSLYILKEQDNGNLEFEEFTGGGSVDYDVLDARYFKKDDAGNLFTFSGSLLNIGEQLPSPSKDLVGKVYNIRSEFLIQEPVLTSDGSPEKVVASDGVESLKLETRKYPPGTNVVCYEFKYTLKEKVNGVLTSKEHIDYIWDALGGITEWDWEEVNE